MKDHLDPTDWSSEPERPFLRWQALALLLSVLLLGLLAGAAARLLYQAIANS